MQGSGQYNELEVLRQDVILDIIICNPYGLLCISLPYQHFRKIQQDFLGQNSSKPSDWDTFPLPPSTSKKPDFNNGLQIRKHDGKVIVTTT